MKKIIALSFLTLLLAGCGSTNVDPMLNQKLAANKLGLASTDEVTISNVKEGEADALGAKTVTFDAVTGKGRRFVCSYRVTPSLMPFDKPSITGSKCAPK